MDIDFCWALGGCRFPYPNCMATTLKINSSSSVLEISTKSHHFFLFFGLLFILLALVNSSGDPSKFSSDMASTLPSRETLFSESSAEKAAAKTVDFHPRKSGNRHASKSKGKDQFEASDHEVPSGPNPISNR
ncbi:hypothetical protein Pfo_006545 [Paulownia fortunei]|nr:hypothetical protein Pfo_006545 [Paulownia fortunei]